MGMYQGDRKFSKEQVIFMVEVHLTAAIDRAEAVRPIPGPDDEREQAKSYGYLDGVADTAGMGLATIYAQLTDDGMAIQDALEHINFESVIQSYASQFGEPEQPDCHKLAEDFVEKVFGEAWFRLQRLEQNDD